MGAKKVFVKGLAAGAVLGAIAAFVHAMEDKDKKEVAKKAAQIKANVVKHAKTIGALSKGAYGKVVDATVHEFRGTKALSEDEIEDMARDLHDGWEDVKKLVKTQVPKLAKKAKAAVRKVATGAAKKTAKKKRA